MTSVDLLEDFPKFLEHQSIRCDAAEKFFQQIINLRIHLMNRNWELFDKLFASMDVDDLVGTESERIDAVYKVTDLATMFFRPFTEAIRQRVCQRIALAQSISPKMSTELVSHFESKQKVSALENELWSIREQWRRTYPIIAPIYVGIYWDDQKHNLDDYAIDQKRFEDLKPLYVDCFETFCRISVVAAGLEGIIAEHQVGVPSKKRLLPIDDFDLMANGSKPDVLKGLPIGDMFVPFMDHNLRNGLGHHAAHYEVKDDSIHYVTENAKGRKEHKISYVRFCEKIVRLYSQIETVATYSYWLSKSAHGIVWTPS